MELLDIIETRLAKADADLHRWPDPRGGMVITVKAQMPLPTGFNPVQQSFTVFPNGCISASNSGFSGDFTPEEARILGDLHIRLATVRQRVEDID